MNQMQIISGYDSGRNHNWEGSPVFSSFNGCNVTTEGIPTASHCLFSPEDTEKVPEVLEFSISGLGMLNEYK